MAAAKKAAGKQAITLHDHIKELRNRFFFVAIVLITATTVAYYYKDFLIYYLLKPLGDEKLIYLNPAGGFSFIFQVTLYVGIAVAVPFLVYNLYKFVSPALPERARKHSALVMLSSLLLLSVGVSFGYIFAIPGALNFLNNFAAGYVIPSLTADSYLNFILAYTAGLGILFQLPLVLLLIHWVHPLKPKGLFKFERYMVLIAFVGAAMITPTPDIMNQLVIALPIILMYQIGVVAICISVYRANKRERPAKPTRAERKAAKHASKAAKKTDSRKPVGIPALSETPVLAAKVIQPAVAKPAKPIGSPKRVMDVTGPIRKITVTSPQVALPKKSMDIMMAPKTVLSSQITTGSRGAIPHKPRPVHHRTPQLQVPRRTGVSIDGVMAS